MQRRTLLVGVGSLVAGSGIPGAAAREQTAKSREEQVANAEKAFADTMVRRDIESFAAHLAEEAIFFAEAQNRQVLRGKTAVVEGWRKFFDGPSAPFSWTPDLVTVLDSGTLALSTGPVSDPKGTVVGRFNSIWRLERDGQWRVVFDKGCPVCR